MTVGELMGKLAALPPDTPVLVTGYEAGFAPCTLSVEQVQELDRTSDGEYLGRYVMPAEAAEELDGCGSDWLYMVGRELPRRVGEPFRAVLLRREGR
ncbi:MULTISPECIES: hypothetical protein [Mycobacterium]|uniref:Uncharacterized protein n=1 Tax=Mycobacterium syngnathidarum TaxID=1908205 RepID=A0A1S1JUW9_9MYCO|nr:MULTISPECIES: hypothetical protein [Mycobacterium]MCG7611339.1 hypothetical protein [Mycobacterium sp. CnD-18-1]OHT89992.1 hypothetical protein BKG61_27575 [Mycobacterium syngnathidarum]OLT89793.1 hypothetical protein BKG60_25315 [Mycobacterium syngnathidarum]